MCEKEQKNVLVCEWVKSNSKLDFDNKNQSIDHYTDPKRTRSVWKKNLHCFCMTSSSCHIVVEEFCLTLHYYL